MIAFRVWVQSLGSASGVRVEGSENARWLLGRLSQSFIFKSSEPVSEELNGSGCTFRVPHNSQLSFSAFKRLLAAMPEVHLMAGPA